MTRGEAFYYPTQLILQLKLRQKHTDQVTFSLVKKLKLRQEYTHHVTFSFVENLIINYKQ